MCPPAALSSTVHLMNSQFLLWDVTPLFHQSTFKFLNTSEGTHGYMCFSTPRTISCPSCLPVALSRASYIAGIAVHCSDYIWVLMPPCSRTVACSCRWAGNVGFFLLVFFRVSRKISLFNVRSYYNCDLKCLLQVSHVHVQKLFMVHWTSIRNIV